MDIENARDQETQETQETQNYEDFQNFVNSEGANLTPTPSSSIPLSNSSAEGDNLQDSSAEESFAKLKQFAPIIDNIQANPQLQQSFNQWYAENFLGVKQPTEKSATQPSQQPYSPTELHQQWLEAYNQDPVMTTATLVQRMLEGNQKQLIEQWQSQLQPINKFAIEMMKNNFEQNIKNDSMYKQIKPIYDSVVAQLPIEQIQQNPQILEAVYNMAVGKLYRNGQLAATNKSSNKGTSANIPSSLPGTSIPPVGKTSSNLSKEEQYLLNKYSRDISLEDFLKYGGE